MSDHPLIKVEPTDPNRCQSSDNFGQCDYQVVAGTKHCPRHGGVRAEQSQEKRRTNLYRIEKYQQRIKQLIEPEEAKSLREEVAILRMLLEEMLNHYQSTTEMICYSGRISNLVLSIEKTLTSSEKLEAKAGLSLDKATAMLLATRIVDLVSREVTDTAAIQRVSLGILDLLAEIRATA